MRRLLPREARQFAQVSLEIRLGLAGVRCEGRVLVDPVAEQPLSSTP